VHAFGVPDRIARSLEPSHSEVATIESKMTGGCDALTNSDLASSKSHSNTHSQSAVARWLDLFKSRKEIIQRTPLDPE
jgi:hypothetical protein